MAKFGIALGSGPRGLGFESRYSDQKKKLTRRVGFLLYLRQMEIYKMGKRLKEFIAKETVLCIAALCAALTMILVPPDAE